MAEDRGDDKEKKTKRKRPTGDPKRVEKTVANLKLLICRARSDKTREKFERRLEKLGYIPKAA